MQPFRRQTANLLFMAGGTGMIAVASLRLINQIEYLPTDLRSQPWFYPVSSAILAAFGLGFLVVGVIRFVSAARRRKP